MFDYLDCIRSRRRGQYIKTLERQILSDEVPTVGIVIDYEHEDFPRHWRWNDCLDIACPIVCCLEHTLIVRARLRNKRLATGRRVTSKGGISAYGNERRLDRRHLNAESSNDGWRTMWGS